MVYELEGVQFDLEYTIGTKRELLKIFGTQDKIAAAFATNSDVELAENAAKIGSAMMASAYQRQKARSAILGTEVTAKVIDAESLFQLLDDASTIRLINAITATIKEANDTQVEAKSEGKKEEAMS